MCGPHHCLGRDAFASGPEILRRLLQWGPHASIPGERCTGLARRRSRRAHSLSPNLGRTASPICPDLIYDRHNKRHSTTTLFAALNVLDGTVIGRNMQRHRHQEFIRFLNAIEAEVPAGKALHVILDNYAAHKHPNVRRWLNRHERFTFHFTPTSCSWLNAVEGFFAKLTKRRLKRGVFVSVVDLQAAINRFVVEHISSRNPFPWTPDPTKFIQAVSGG